jgi:hypothetical protein
MGETRNSHKTCVWKPHKKRKEEDTKMKKLI